MATKVFDDTCAYSASSTSVNDDRVKIESDCDWLPSQRRVRISYSQSTLTRVESIENEGYGDRNTFHGVQYSTVVQKSVDAVVLWCCRVAFLQR